ncbi:helix-turn-helix transcriptional regulator [Danxiaibacter flavus]|uniref:Helix-turn-helix transcriptional regulator n=1 Tax=Danxiaibacter flavus TaxID=3049108 RepID=A0ABV3ZIT5_9BACT|nr:helix-turn-helix transcriptional regulator [Chitinophagaceae bacterium DXS]
MTNKTMPNAIHHGRNLKRMREILGVKQEALALDLGDDWNQRKVSVLEAKEEIDDNILNEVAKALKVPVEAIKNFNEETSIFNIQNNYEGANTGNGTIGINHHCTFNPIEKIVELYDALIKSEREKIALLERMLQEKNK